MWTQRLTDQFVRDGLVTLENADIVNMVLEALVDNILAFLLMAFVGFSVEVCCLALFYGC